MSRYFTNASSYGARLRLTNARTLATATTSLIEALDVAFQDIESDIDSGSGGGSGAPLVFNYSALPVWVVNHNLGRDVTVEVRSSGGAQIGVEVLQYSLNQVRVYFEIQVPGKVLIR